MPQFSLRNYLLVVTPGEPKSQPSKTPLPVESGVISESEAVKRRVDTYVAGVASRIKTEGEQKKQANILGFDFTTSNDGQYVQYRVKVTVPATPARPLTTIEIYSDGEKKGDNEIDTSKMTLLEVITTTDYPETADRPAHQERKSITMVRPGAERTADDWQITNISDEDAKKSLKHRENPGETYHKDVFSTAPREGQGQLTRGNFTTFKSEADTIITQALS